ncbi:uncharacterized protein [Cicer arietinum]|uniref:uncharacterized protein n=1 Tax=Cicer arietinum TaxID=3827 RepID=UPI003CC6B9DF
MFGWRKINRCIPNGFMIDNAATFKALLMYIEHPYYVESMPSGSIEEAYKNTSTYGYLNSSQALADYAHVVIHLKETLQAQKSPVIVMGVYYGGMESSIDGIPDGFMIDNAATFKALLLYIEHRYYSESMSFGSIEEAYKNSSTLGYLNSTQVLADYAHVCLLHGLG